MKPDEQNKDLNQRPIVARRKPRRYFVWAGTGVIALAAVAGTTAAWSATNDDKGGTPATHKTAEPGDDKGAGVPTDRK